MDREIVFRHEFKYRVSRTDRALLMCRLGKVLQPDPHGRDGVYTVRTLYFDTLYDDALRENVSSEAEKTKFRLRIYNMDDSFLRLEKKVKRGCGGYKCGAMLTREECERLLRGEHAFLRERNDAFLQECYARAENGGLRPVSVVQYMRAAYIGRDGNVRITIDSDIRTSRFTNRFLDPHLGGAPVAAADGCVLEIKYDRFLPDFIPHLVGIGSRELQACSKYALGRQYY